MLEQRLNSNKQPQKTALIILSVLFVLVLFFSVWQLIIKIKKPFIFTANQENTNQSKVTSLNENTDTDNDGLTDYEELFVYGTSPYLEDTDSDGFLDKDEVTKGTDPKCPDGQNCFSFDNSALDLENVAAQENLGGIISSEPDIQEPTNTEGAGQIDLQNLAGSIDAATLRQILKDNGADQAILDQLSDEDLMQSYQAALNQQNE